MNSLVFFGSLRSKELLKVIIDNNLEHLKFYNAKIFRARLFKVNNENFPYLEKTNSNIDFVNCTYITGLMSIDLEKILFYESIEYKINPITINLDNININTFFFDLKKKNKTNEKWNFEEWQIEFEKISCIAAKSWMSLFNKYKSDPGKAEIYWQKILEEAKKNK